MTDLEYLSSEIAKRAGINLTAAKHDLVRSRLTPLLLELGLKDPAEYRQYLEQLPSSDPAWQNLINALTTNKTDFFREPDHFQFLTETFLPYLEGKYGNRGINVWSAASSTGEEPYTLSMVLNRHFGNSERYRILATDIDTEALAYARNGVYPMARLDQIPQEYQEASAVLGSEGLEAWWKMSSAIRKPVDYKQCNLIQTPYKWTQRFEIILCRNVFIYFKPETISKAVTAMYECAAPDSVLMIGHTESLQGIEHPWTYLKPSVFVKGGLGLKGRKK